MSKCMPFNASDVGLVSTVQGVDHIHGRAKQGPVECIIMPDSETINSNTDPHFKSIPDLL